MKKMSNVYENIRNCKYVNKVQFVSIKVDPVAYDLYDKEEQRIYHTFKSDVLVELELLSYGKDGQIVFKHKKADLLFDMAWEDGHAGGYDDVWCEACNLVQLLR